MGRTIATKKVVHIADTAAEQVYTGQRKPNFAAVELGGARTFLAVPMLKESELIGIVNVYRQEVRPFTDKQIGWSRTSPPKPSSPSKMRGCSPNCANR